jgi:carboxyl-terminal processing protease
MRDNRRATIVGARSYGKGSVQGIFPLSQGGAGVRLTTAKFYSPQGRAISKVGVQPDIVVRQALRPADGGVQVPTTRDDETLEAALRSARSQLASR